MDLSAWAYCYQAGCVDGFPPEQPADVGMPEQVVVEFPVPDWSFTASFQPAGDECGRIQEAPLTPTGDGTFVLLPVGYADAYDVTLSGRGEDGDLTPPSGGPPRRPARCPSLADSWLCWLRTAGHSKATASSSR